MKPLNFIQSLSVLSFIVPLCVAGCGAKEGPSTPPTSLEDSSDEASSSLVAAAAWFPLESGNRWTLSTVNSPTAEAHVIDVGQTVSGMGVVDGLAGINRDAWFGYGTRSPSVFYVWNGEAQEWSPFVKFGRAVGATWTTKLDNSGCGTFTARVASRQREVTTPAGTFAKAYRVDFTLKPKPNVRCMQPTLASVSFVEGVGVVGFGRAAQQEAFSLVTAEVSGTTYPSALYVKLEELEANPKAYDGKLITVVAEPFSRGASCTKMGCSTENPCCNQCSARFIIGNNVGLFLNGDELSCAGNECSWQNNCNTFSGFENGRYALTGVFLFADFQSSLNVQKFVAADCRKTGCGGEVCANRDVFTTCIVAPEQTCYQELDVPCEAQSDGACGWTSSPELVECLNRRY